MGVEEYLYSGNWCFIEWAEIPNLIPESHSIISIKELPDGRRALVKLNYSCLFYEIREYCHYYPFSWVDRV
jgi:tRNA A37 threonylcarbamoyladenosine biosynthesis protein TsaE